MSVKVFPAIKAVPTHQEVMSVAVIQDIVWWEMNVKVHNGV